MRHLRPQLFDALAALTAIAAVVVGMWRGSAVTPAPYQLPTPLIVANSTAAIRAADTRADSEAVVNANVFSGSRHAPRAHYVSPDAMLASASAPAVPAPVMTGDSAATDSATASNGEPVPHLYGIVSQDGVRRALLRLSPQQSGPQLYAEGDAYAGWVVLHIETDRVIVQPTSRRTTGSGSMRVTRGSPGQRTLRLIARDSNLTSGIRP